MSHREPSPATTTRQTSVTSATVLLVAAGRGAQGQVDTALAEHSFTLRHLGALGHLARDSGPSYSDLARRVDITVQTMHAPIFALVDLDAIAVETTERGRAANLRPGPPPARSRATLLDAARQFRENGNGLMG